MGIELPGAFIAKMKRLLGDEEFEAFLASYDDKRWYGLRLNALKIDEEHYAELSPWGNRLQPIPWADGGYYYDDEIRPGKHPHYHAGLYYIQEPSAMAPAELLDVKPGHYVLDLCAAPGGKSTQLAGKLQGRGVLVANDNARERTKALAKNIELAGVRNAIVLNEEPEALATVFELYFDRILVDAPCSGEGMFRKDDSMITQWEKHSVRRCAHMQRDILKFAVKMLAPGGRLVYSTCTFSPEENEAQIAALVTEHPELSVSEVPLANGWMPGRPDWVDYSEDQEEREDRGGKAFGAAGQIRRTVRLWPHKVRGEGHYAAVLVKADDTGAVRGDQAGQFRQANHQDGRNSGRDNGRSGKNREMTAAHSRTSRYEGAERTGKGKDKGQAAALRRADREMSAEERWKGFAKEQLLGFELWPGKLISYGNRVYLQPPGVPPLDGLQVVRPGWYLGEAGKHRFEPSQPLAMALHETESVRSLRLGSDEEAAIRYLKGETIEADEGRFVYRLSEGAARAGGISGSAKRTGTVLVCVDGFPVGWGKWDGVMLKNGLAAGWRRT
ncbi:RsmB/NOP family class I SAM-dependent RNA methyltransferase [Paenibacillus tarimensis]